MSTDTRLKVLIVDGHDIVRKGLAMLLTRQGDLLVVGEAGTVADAVNQAQELEPDVVVLDFQLPDGSGAAASREMRNNNKKIKVLMLTSYGDDEAIMGSVIAGASGYLLKEIRSQEIVDAIRTVGYGTSLLAPGVTANALERLCRRREENPLTHPAEKEHRILELISYGWTDREIAEEVNLSDKTVKSCVNAILSELTLSRLP